MTTAKKTTKVDVKFGETKPDVAKTIEAKATETVKVAVSAGKEALETVVKASTEAAETVVKSGTEAAAKGYEKAVAVSKEHVEAAAKAGADAFKGYEDVIAYNRNNMDALMKVGAIWAKGFQDINKEMTVLANTSMEQSVTATKQILGCKTVEEVVALQSDLAKANYDKVVAESRKLSEMGVKLAETAAQPIAVRVNETVANFSKPLAA